MSEFNLAYPMNLEKMEDDGEYYFVTFRDLDNCFTQGDTPEEAIENARDVLGMMLWDYLEDEKPLPKASKKLKGEALIEPLPEVAAPLLLYIARTYRKMTLTEAAKLMGVSKQRYFDIEHGKNLTLKTLSRASKVVGFNPSLGLVAG